MMLRVRAAKDKTKIEIEVSKCPRCGKIGLTDLAEYWVCLECTMILAKGLRTSPCEWDPVNNRAHDGVIGCPSEAEISVGANGQWHLCEECAALPQFKRFRKRTALR